MGRMGPGGSFGFLSRLSCVPWPPFLTLETIENRWPRDIMGYEVHIQREDEAEITLDEWCRAVEATEGMRPATRDAVARNPATGEVICIAHNPGDVEVYFPEDDAWIPCLWYSRGRISFRPPGDFGEPASPFRRAIVALAMQLNAQVMGDEGEVYK